jgi:transcriptional regulator with XRE-family HTH domain
MTSTKPTPGGPPPRPDSPDSRRRTYWRAELLRADMEAAGVKPSELAEVLGVKPQVVSNWRRIGAVPSKHLEAIALLLDRPVRRYLAPDADADADADPDSNTDPGAADAPSAPRAPGVLGVRVLPVRSYLLADKPAAGAARQSIEGRRRWITAASQAISGRAFGVELPEGTISLAGAMGGGVAVVDPGRDPKPGGLVLVWIDQHGPAVRRYGLAEGRAFTSPLGAVEGARPLDAEKGVRMLGPVLEFHPAPTVF